MKLSSCLKVCIDVRLKVSLIHLDLPHVRGEDLQTQPGQFIRSKASIGTGFIDAEKQKTWEKQAKFHPRDIHEFAQGDGAFHSVTCCYFGKQDQTYRESNCQTLPRLGTFGPESHPMDFFYQQCVCVFTFRSTLSELSTHQTLPFSYLIPKVQKSSLSSPMSVNGSRSVNQSEVTPGVYSPRSSGSAPTLSSRAGQQQIKLKLIYVKNIWEKGPFGGTVKKIIKCISIHQFSFSHPLPDRRIGTTMTHQLLVLALQTERHTHLYFFNWFPWKC